MVIVFTCYYLVSNTQEFNLYGTIKSKTCCCIDYYFWYTNIISYSKNSSFWEQQKLMAQPNKGQRVKTIILNGIWKNKEMERNPLNNCMTKTRKQQEQQQRMSEKWKGSTFATYDLSNSGWRHVFEFSSLFLDFDVWTEIAWIRCGEMGMFCEGIYRI